MPTPPHRQLGLTLVELMIAVILGLLIIAAVSSLYINASRSFREDDQYARMLENGRFAVRFLSQDLQMADFWGYYMLPDDIDDADDTVCGVQPYQTVGGTTGAVQLITNLTGDCTEGALADDGILIRRVGGPPTVGGEPYPLDPDGRRMYLEVRAELKEAGAFKASPTAPSPSNIPVQNDLWEYRSAAYYLDDGQLCRRSFAFNPPQDRECLVGGIAAWEFLWSIDTSGDGQANVLTTTPTTAQLRGAVGVRICLLLESERELRNFIDDKIYTLCGVQQNGGAALGGGFLRRVFEKNVELRNASNVILFREF